MDICRCNYKRSLRVNPRIYDINTPCTAQTQYSGTLQITGDSFTGGFRLREVRNGVNIQTLNLHGSTVYANATDFANTNTNFTNGNWSNFNQDRAALDAHWGGESVLDYWKIVHNRNSINGSGMAVLNYVHNPIGNNAYWDDKINAMNYGDGDGVTFNPLTALDVCSHEIGHGITQFTANLTPGTQESGALNEGFSDIWGACVEYRSAPTKQTWLVGEEIFRTTAFTCLRNLQNPKSTTTYEGPHPNTYHGNFWDNNGEPHNNSTVLSHWFYLISQGGTGTNDIGNNFVVNAIGIDHAQKIAYRAESVYLTSASNYTAARTATIQAARDLYGNCSNDVISTTNAWFAVGVGTAFNGIPAKPGPITTVLVDYHIGKIQVQIDPVPDAISYNWYKDGVLVNIPSEHGTSAQIPITRNRCNVGYGIEVEAVGDCGTSAKTYKGVFVPCDNNFYVVSPNPAQNEITISTGDAKTQSMLSSSFDNVKIFDIKGSLIKYQHYQKAKQALLDISELNNGTYFIEISNDTYAERQKIVIQK